MAFKIFKKERSLEEDEGEFIEIQGPGEEQTRLNIRIESLNDYRDVENVQRHLREGNIIFLRIKRMRERDMGELKRCIERLRRTSLAMNGDIIGVDEDYIILTPPSVSIYRGEKEKKAE